MARLALFTLLFGGMVIALSLAGCGVKGPPRLPEKTAQNAPFFNPISFFASSDILVDIVPSSTV